MRECNPGRLSPTHLHCQACGHLAPIKDFPKNPGFHRICPHCGAEGPHDVMHSTPDGRLVNKPQLNRGGSA